MCSPQFVWARLSAWIAVLALSLLPPDSALAVNGCSLVVTNTADAGPGSLRAAIDCANILSGPDTITFAIPGAGPHVIQLVSPLSAITDPVTIDGWSQSGSHPNTSESGAIHAIVQVEVRGSAGIPDGLRVMAPDSVIQGLSVYSFGVAGIRVFSNNVAILGNIIGVDSSGHNVSTSGQAGVVVDGAQDILVGGTSAAARNLISGNGGAGVWVHGSGVASIVGNSIFNNGALGIDLDSAGSQSAGDGVTPNDNTDADVGPNGLQNYPILTLATNQSGQTLLQGSLASQPGKQYWIDVYSNAACDPSGYGEGEGYLGRIRLTTDVSGNGSFLFSVTPALSVGTVLTATATTDAGETSEFSACASVLPETPVLPATLGIGVTASPEPVTVGTPLTYSVSVTNQGPGELQDVTLTDPLPDGLTEVRVVTDHGNCEIVSRVVHCSFGSLTNGEVVHVTIVGTPSVVGPMINQVTADGLSQGKPVSATASVTSQVVQAPLSADLAIANLTGPVFVEAGQVATLQMNITNRGPDGVNHVFLTNSLPADTDFVAATLNGTNANCSLVQRLLVCDLGPLPAGASSPVQIQLRPHTPGTITNTFTVASSDVPDPDFSNNTATLNTPVNEPPGDALFAELLGPMTLNRQTGLLEQRLRVTNLGVATRSRIRVLFHGMPAGAVVYNAAGSEGDVPFVQLAGALEGGASAEFLLEYNLPKRKAIANPELSVKADAGTLPETAAGTPIDLSRTLMISGNRFLMEFPSIPGRFYLIQYSDDGGKTWKSAFPNLKAPADRAQWLDDGPPKTEKAPSETPARLYRVFLLPE